MVQLKINTKKTLTFLYLLTIFSSTYPFFFDRLFDFREYSEKQTRAVENLDNYIQQIKVSRSVSYIVNTLIIEWHYRFQTLAARASFDQYRKTDLSLAFRVFVDVLGKGCLLGLLVF